MSIVSHNTLKANGFTATLTNRLKFYYGDRLNLSFSINNKLISEVNSEEVIDGLLPIDSPNIEAKMLIEKHEIVGTIIEDNNVVFMLEPEYQKIGVTKFQIVIIENHEDGSKEILHTPPFPIEIAEPIGYNGEGGGGEEGGGDEEKPARVGYAIVDKSKVAPNSTVKVSIDEGYTMTVWQTGDLITADRLNNIERALDSLLYKAISISSFNASRTVGEFGENLINITLSWSFNKTPTYQRLDGANLDIETRSLVIEESITTNRLFKIEAGDGKTDVSRTIGVSFYNGRYHGVSAERDYDSNFILKLTKTLTNSRSGNFTVNCGAGQYIYFAMPIRFGTPTFSVGGFSGGFVRVAAFDFTNSFGYTEPYEIWKSENSDLGNTTVVVG